MGGFGVAFWALEEGIIGKTVEKGCLLGNLDDTTLHWSSFCTRERIEIER